VADGYQKDEAAIARLTSHPYADEDVDAEAYAQYRQLSERADNDEEAR
jgi:hypothetical protein